MVEPVTEHTFTATIFGDQELNGVGVRGVTVAVDFVDTTSEAITDHRNTYDHQVAGRLVESIELGLSRLTSGITVNHTC